jgi:hypothetical protein
MARAPARNRPSALPDGCMHCSRLAGEFLHFLPISGRLADARQAIESTPLLDFLHFRHFLQPLPLDCTPLEQKVRASTAPI